MNNQKSTYFQVDQTASGIIAEEVESETYRKYNSFIKTLLKCGYRMTNAAGGYMFTRDTRTA